jgi:uncharacterized Fe-S cluster-containing radical SAM superfamily enzyme
MEPFCSRGPVLPGRGDVVDVDVVEVGRVDGEVAGWAKRTRSSSEKLGSSQRAT